MEYNSTANGTFGNSLDVRVNNETDENMQYQPYETAAATISLLMFVIIVILNGMVIHALLFKKHKKSRLFFFVLHLAIADFLVGICSALSDGIHSAMYNEWYGGDIVCRIYRFIGALTLIASNNLVICMSVDRFLAIKYPLNAVRMGFSRYLDKAMVISAWFISLVGSSFYIVYSKGVNANPDAADFMEQKGSCDIVFPNPSWWKPYVLTMAMLMYVLPTIGITICYVGICIIVWMKWRSRLKLSEIDTNASCDRLHGKSSLNEGLLPKAKVKSIKMTMVVCLAFFLCWTPYFAFVLHSIFNQVTIDQQKVFLVFNCLYTLNSACNPLIFIIFNHRLFSCRQHDKLSAPSYEGMSTQMTST